MSVEISTEAGRLMTLLCTALEVDPLIVSLFISSPDLCWIIHLKSPTAASLSQTATGEVLYISGRALVSQAGTWRKHDGPISVPGAMESE